MRILKVGIKRVYIRLLREFGGVLSPAKRSKDSFDLIYRREAVCSNAIWQADHTPLDIELLQSDVDSAMTAKPWLSVILDDYSRAVAGVLSLIRIPIFAEYRPRPATGNLAQG